MNKNGFDRAADLVRAAKAIASIIRAGLQGGWIGAAAETVKRFWPKILILVIVIIMLPVIILVSLPAILFGFDGTAEDAKAQEMMACYDLYDQYRNEQLDEIKARHGGSIETAYINDSFDVGWLVAIHSVQHENDLNLLTEDNLKDLIRVTYTYEIVEAQREEEESEVSNPWEGAEQETMESSASSEESEPSSVLKVTTLNASSVMNALEFDKEQTDWATLIYETFSQGQGDLPANSDSRTIAELIKDDDTPYIGGDYTSPFPTVRWQDYVSSEYGKRTDPVTGKPNASHNGIDLALTFGTPIHAVQGGMVLYVRRTSGGYGLHLAINHGGKTVTLYAHCSEVLVREGDTIRQGDVIALVGSTGKSTGPHLHLEFIMDGVPKNPRLYLPRE